MFGATNISKNCDKDKKGYSGYGIAFDWKVWWSFVFFGNNFLRNVVIFGVCNSSSSHSDNCKNKILILDECPISDIKGSFGSAERKFSINFTKANTKFWLILHYYGDNSYLFVNGKETYKIKAAVVVVKMFFSNSILFRQHI